MTLQSLLKFSRFFGLFLAWGLFMTQSSQTIWADETYILTKHQGYRPVITLERAIARAQEEAAAEDAAQPLERGSMGRETQLHSGPSEAAEPASGDGEAAPAVVSAPAASE